MAEEQLNLVDGMSASLRRIYQEAERLNKRMLTLKSNIKALEKPMSMSYLRRELKATEQQAQQTERAIKAMVRAEALNSKYGAFKVGANGVYYVNGIPVPNSNRTQMAENYVRNVANGKLRRDRLLWETGRITANGTFDQRVQAWQTANIKRNTTMNAFNEAMTSTTMNLGKFRNAVVGTAITLGSLSFIGGLVKQGFQTVIEPMNRYTSNYMRTNLTSDRSVSPREMMMQLYDTAIRTRSDARGTMMLYNRIAMSGVRASNEQIRRFVETFNKTMMISGTSGQENRAVMLQLAQGMGSNRLGGDEFRSIAEQAPMFKYMLAKGLGVNPGALKEMGAQGKLTADAIMKAMMNVQDLVDTIAQDAPLQIDQVLTIIQAKWEKFMSSNMSGYIAVRDLLKQVSDWMDTTEGQETLNILVSAMNVLIYRTVRLIKSLKEPVLFVLTHLKQIGTVLKTLAIVWVLTNWQILLGSMVSGLIQIQAGLIRTITQVGSLGYALMNAGTMSKIAMGGMVTSIKSVGVALHTWVPELLLILGLMLAITKLIPLIKDSAKETSYVDTELRKKYTDEQLNQAYREQQKMLNSQGIAVKPSGLYQQIQQDRVRLTEEYRKNNPMEGTPEYYKKITEDAMKDFEKLQKGTQGVMDSSKNIPMVGKVGEVGKINDKVSIDNDGIEMMKTIAERQWVMQNEVTVPQKVEVQITKEVDVSEDRIAEVLTGGTKIAVASSMRGAATT